MKVGDAVFLYPLDDVYNSGMLHIDGNDDEWFLSNLGPDHGVYKHKATSAHIYRRPSATALAAYVANGGVAEV